MKQVLERLVRPEVLELRGARWIGSPERRQMEIAVGSMMGLGLSLPVAACAVASMVQFETTNPFYKDRRVGQRIDGTAPILDFYKIQTLRPTNGARSPHSGHDHDDATWFTRHVRRTRLDEAPQLWHVIRTGRLSLIGPRPHHTQEMRRFKHAGPPSLYREFASIKPGLFDVAQLAVLDKGSYGNAICSDENHKTRRTLMALSCVYNRYASLENDLRTIAAVGSKLATGSDRGWAPDLRIEAGRFKAEQEAINPGLVLDLTI